MSARPWWLLTLELLCLLVSPCQPVETLAALRAELQERLWRGCRTQPQARGCPLESPKRTWVWSVTNCSCNHSLTQHHPSLQEPGAGSAWPGNALGHHCMKHSTWNSHWMRSRNPPGSGSAGTPQAELWLRIPPVLSPGHASLTFLCVTASMTQSFLLLQPAFPPHLQPILSFVAKFPFTAGGMCVC